MLSDRAADSLRDMLAAIELIDEWVRDRGGSEQAISDDKLLRSAIERQLLIVSEAAIRIDHAEPDFGPRYAPEIDWSGVRGIGNVIRHRYDEMDRQVVDNVARHELGALKAACRRILAGG